MQISIEVNGAVHQIEIDGPLTLLDLLRDRLGLTGTKRVCDEGACGACIVLLDRLPVCACILLAASCRDRRIETIEGIGGDRLHPLQEAFIARDALRCGFCAPAQIMALKGLLDIEPDPSEDAVRRAISGVCCRCGESPAIVAAALQAAAVLRLETAP